MKIDFYILEEASGQKSLFFACRLIEKIIQEQKQIFIHTDSKEEADRLDTLLWTYREDSFIPHNIYSSTDDYPPPIQIGFGETPIHHHMILLNLSREIPAFYGQFNHLIEIVFSDPLMQQWARGRYKQYREQGHEITTYKLKANEI